MKSRDNQALKWEDLLAENFALENEKWEATNTLAAIAWEKQQLISAIYKKNMEKTGKLDQIVSNISNMIIQHPEDTITHLHATFGTVMGNKQEAIIATMQPEAHDTIH